jgi:hypothetical protein
MSSTSKVRFFFALLAGAVSCCAQISQASLEGTIKDNSGAAIPGAAVTLRNKGTTAARSAVSDPAGQYSFPNLDPAEYTLSAAYKGFKTLVIGSLTLHTGERSTVDLTLQVGDATQEVTVDAAVPLLSTTSTEVSHLVPPSQVAELPLNGRNFWELTQLTPGATFIPRGQLSQYNGSEIRPRNVNVTVNGQGYIFTGWSLDGATVTNFELGGTLIVPNVDAIQEFSVLSGNMAPEFGHTPNMIVASLKSGTNSYHGNLFEFLRNQKLDARNFFVANREPLKRNQFGGTLGGPIKKDNVFFFVDYQGTRLRQGTLFNYVVPSLPERSGDFSDLLPGRTILDPLTRLPFPGNIIPADRLSQPGKFLAPFIPLPNVIQGTTFRSAFSTNLPLGQNLGDARVDARINDRNMLMARYSVSSSYESSPNPFPTVPATNLHSKAQDYTVRWTKILSPTIQNVAQAALYDSPFIFGAVGPGVNINGMAGIQGFENPTVVPEQSWPTIGISGYQGFQGSPSDQRPKYMRIRHLQLSDSINVVRGRHEMKAGMEWLHRNDGFHIGQNSVGNWSFQGAYTGNGFADLLMGIPDSGTRSPVQTLQGDYDDFKAWHFNDTFRVRPGLTLNLGIRWDINPFMKGIRRTRSGFDPVTGKVIVPSGLQNDPTAQPLTGLLLQLFGDRVAFTDDLGLPQSVTPSDHRNVAPRVGIAWTPMQKTVVRAAYGIFFAFPDTNLVNNTVVTVPFVVNSQVFNDRAPAAPTRTFSNFFQGAPIASANPNPGQPCSFGLVLTSCDTPNMTSALVNLREQYTQQWNLTVQREITSRVAFTAAYVGSRTVRLQQGQRRNDPPPGPGAIQARRPYPQWGAIGLQEWGGKGTYNALQTSLEVRDWHGLTLMGSFVRAKCLDNGSDDGGAPSMALIGLNYAPCDFDQANTSSVSFNYGIPVGRGKAFLNHLPGVVDGVLGGWQVAAVTTLKSGLPFTPTIGSDRANTGAGGQRPNAIGPAFVPQNINCWYYTSANSSCRSLFPNATDTFFVPAQYTIGTSGRNIPRADNLSQLDFSLLKDMRIREAKRLQFRAEFFNILNHPVFNPPGANIDQGSGGQVSSTLNSNRIIEFALKFYF